MIFALSSVPLVVSVEYLFLPETVHASVQVQPLVLALDGLLADDAFLGPLEARQVGGRVDFPQNAELGVVVAVVQERLVALLRKVELARALVRLAAARTAFARLAVVEQLQLVQFVVAEAAVFERHNERSFDALVGRLDGRDFVSDGLRKVDDRVQVAEHLQLDVPARALAVDDEHERQTHGVFAAEKQHFLCLPLHVHVKDVESCRRLRGVELVAEGADVHADELAADEAGFLDALADLVRVVNVEQQLGVAADLGLDHLLELGHAHVVVDVGFDVDDAAVLRQVVRDERHFEFDDLDDRDRDAEDRVRVERVGDVVALEADEARLELAVKQINEN